MQRIGLIAMPACGSGVHDIILSCARDDQPITGRLYDDLVRAGHRVWRDRECTPSRAPALAQEIRDAMAACQRLIAVVGCRALAFDRVRSEWQRAVLLQSCSCEGALAALLCVFALTVSALGLMRSEVSVLPPRFQRRVDDVCRLDGLLPADTMAPGVIIAKGQTVVLGGMGGTGKSGLATALLCLRLAHRHFTDGVLWLPVSLSASGSDDGTMRVRDTALGRPVACSATGVSLTSCVVAAAGDAAGRVQSLRLEDAGVQPLASRVFDGDRRTTPRSA